MDTTNPTSAINKALAQAQGEIKSAKFNRTNPHFKNKYADLTAMRDAYQESFSRFGLSLVQLIEDKPDGMVLITRILHESGESIESRFPIKVGPNDTMQVIGSKITYARRYSISAIIAFGSEEEDDGEEERKAKAKFVAKPSVVAADNDEEPIEAYEASDEGLTYDQIGVLNKVLANDDQRRSNLLNHYSQMYKDKKQIGSLSDIPQSEFSKIVKILNVGKPART